MAGCVKSVERHLISLSDTTASAKSNLGKSQTLANCVPFMGGTDQVTADHNDELCIDIELTGSPDGVVATRVGTTGAKDIVVWVVEFDSDEVTVKTNTFQMLDTATSDAPSIGDTVVINNTFVLAYWKSTDVTDDWEQMALRYKVDTTTALSLVRDTGTAQIDGHWWTCEAIGATKCWDVQHDENGTGTSDTVAITIGAVTEARTFIILSYDTAEPSDTMINGSWNAGLTATTTITADRGNGQSTARAGDLWTQAVQLASGNGNVYHGQYDYGVTAQATADTTDVDDANSMIYPPGQFGNCESTDNTSAGKYEGHAIQAFTGGGTGIVGDRSGTTGDCLQYFQVVEWTIVPAAAAGQPTMMRWGGVPGMNLRQPGRSW